LHLQFCNLQSDAGQYLADLLANSRSNLELLNVSGNRLGGVGLTALCKGLMYNSKCETLLLADNMIDHQTPEDLEGLRAFRDCLNNPNVNLATVDLMYNRIGKMNDNCFFVFIKVIVYSIFCCIGEVGANILIEAVNPDNTKIKEFLVDLTLPMPLFEQLFRKAGGKKGGKKKGKKK
jgi:hypothetical protein